MTKYIDSIILIVDSPKGPPIKVCRRQLPWDPKNLGKKENQFHYFETKYIKDIFYKARWIAEIMDEHRYFVRLNLDLDDPEILSLSQIQGLTEEELVRWIGVSVYVSRKNPLNEKQIDACAKEVIRQLNLIEPTIGMVPLSATENLSEVMMKVFQMLHPTYLSGLVSINLNRFLFSQEPSPIFEDVVLKFIDKFEKQLQQHDITSVTSLKKPDHHFFLWADQGKRDGRIFQVGKETCLGRYFNRFDPIRGQIIVSSINSIDANRSSLVCVKIPECAKVVRRGCSSFGVDRVFVEAIFEDMDDPNLRSLPEFKDCSEKQMLNFFEQDAYLTFRKSVPEKSETIDIIREICKTCDSDYLGVLNLRTCVSDCINDFLTLMMIEGKDLKWIYHFLESDNEMARFLTPKSLLAILSRIADIYEKEYGSKDWESINELSQSPKLNSLSLLHILD